MPNEPPDPAPPLPRNVKSLGWASLLNDVASEMVFPLVPQFLISALGGNRWQLGLIEGVADSTASLLKLWSGAWSDRVGSRKAFTVVGYALATLARPLIGLAALPWHVFAARAADRIGKGIRTAPRDALIADAVPPDARGRAFGFQRAMDHLGAGIGPLLAAAFLWAWPEGLRWLFLMTILPGLAVVALLWLGLREGRRTAPTTPRRTWSLAPFGRGFRWYLLAVFLFTLGNSSDAFLLVRAAELGVSTPLLPLLWCLFHVVKSSGSFLAGKPIDRFGPRPMILAGWLLYALVYVGFAAAGAAWQAWALFAVYGVFYAVAEPAEKALVADLCDSGVSGAEQRGLAYGWFNLAIGVAALPASLIFGILYERFGAGLAFGCGTGMALVGSAVLSLAAADARHDPDSLHRRADCQQHGHAEQRGGTDDDAGDR